MNTTLIVIFYHWLARIFFGRASCAADARALALLLLSHQHTVTAETSLSLLVELKDNTQWEIPWLITEEATR
jgi:hypothetical protein